MKLIERLIGRGDIVRGREMLDDVAELRLERCARRGPLYAWLRAAWDLAALAVRPPQFAMSPAAAAARRRPMWMPLSNELRHAWRSVRHRPLVSGVAIGSLALGLGLALLTLTVVDAILIRPLPFPRSDELATVYSEFRPESGVTVGRSAMSGPEVLDYAAQNHSLAVAAYQTQGVAFSDDVNGPERLPAVRTSSRVFQLLEVSPLRGRVFAESDDRPGAPCAAVLSNGLWRERFGGANDAIGRTVRVNGEPCEIVGVMPADFAFPSQAARLWIPLAVDGNPNARLSHGLQAVGRLHTATSLDAARRELTGLMSQWAQAMPHYKGHGLVVVSFKDDLVGSVSQELTILAGGIALLLLAIAANLSSVLLAHGHARRRELAVRSALGASRGSLVRQLLLEGWLLAGAGGLLGGALAWVSLRPIISEYPAALPRASEVHVDPRTLALGMAISLVVGLGVALLPAIRLTRGFSATDLNTGDRRTGLALGLRAERILVMGELAISTAVAVGALLLTESFVQLSHVPLGFTASDVTVAVIGLPGGGGRAREWPQQFFAEMTTRLAAVPGVAAAGAISSVPLATFPPPDLFTMEGRPVARPNEPGLIADYVMSTPGAFDTLRIGLMRGRGIEARDVAGADPIAVVNEAFVRQFSNDGDPIGRRIRYPEGLEGNEWTAWGPWITIVGIARDIRSIAPTQAARPAIYVSHAQRPRSFYDGRNMGVLVRVMPGAVDSGAVIRQTMREIDPGASLSVVRTMGTIVGATVARPRFMNWIMGLYAIIALGVAALGVYGIVAYGVERRTREIGVRLALGATRGRVLAGIGWHTSVLLAGGLTAGLAGAWWLARAMTSILYGVTPFDIRVYAIVTLTLAIVVSVAAAWPARRATRVDPLVALRSE